MDGWVKLEKCKCGKDPFILPKARKKKDIFCVDCDLHFETPDEWNKAQKNED